MENILDQAVTDFKKLVQSVNIIGVDETHQVSFALIILRLNPNIHHLVIFKSGTRKPLGVLNKREFVHMFSDAKYLEKTVKVACQETFNLQDNIEVAEKNDLEQERFVFTDATWAKVITLITNPHKRTGQKIDYVLVIDKTKDIHTIITYKDVLKYLKDQNFSFNIKDINYTPKERLASAIKGKKISDFASALSKYRSIPVFEDENKNKFIGMIFDSSVNTEDYMQNLEVTNSQIMTPLSRFYRCKINEDMSFLELIDLFIEYPEFTSIPVFTSNDNLIGIMSYIDLLSSINLTK